MSRTRKICEEINAVVREFRCAYITYNCTGGSVRVIAVHTI